MAAVADTEPVGPPPGDDGKPDVEEWRKDRTGKQWIPRADGRPGRIIRKGEESIEEARERDAAPAEERRPRRKQPKKPVGPSTTDLKEIERMLAQGLQAPAMVCASFGDEWAAEHFQTRGPFLARNLVNAAEHNPWLRRKLEEATAGDEAMVKVLSMLSITGALVMYFVPPTIYFLNLPVPDKARDLLDVPPRRERKPEPEAYAATAPPAEAPVEPPAA